MPKTDDAPDQIIRVRVYLAASWHEASVLRDMRAAISSIPTAQLVDTEPTEWIDAEASGALNTPETRDECLDVVASIVKALRRSDAVIVWNGAPSSRGGMHAELGMAIILGKPIIVVGEPVNLFQSGAAAVVVPDATVDGLQQGLEHAVVLVEQLRRRDKS